MHEIKQLLAFFEMERERPDEGKRKETSIRGMVCNKEVASGCFFENKGIARDSFAIPMTAMRDKDVPQFEEKGEIVRPCPERQFQNRLLKRLLKRSYRKFRRKSKFNRT